MKVLIIGGNGFIGSHLADQLLKLNYEVSILDVSSDPFRKEIPGIHYYFGRLEDESLINSSLGNIDVVFHLVSTTYPSNSNINMAYDVESNLISTIKLLDCMVQNNVKRIVYLSSGGTVYGPTDITPIPEVHALNPISSYGIVKVSIEKYLYLFQILHGIQPLIFRPANVYGPRQRYTKMQGVTAHFIYNALQKKPINIWGDGTSRKDYVFVLDVVNAVVKGVERDLIGTFNLGSGEDFSINEIIEYIQDLVGTELDVEYEPAKGFDVQKVRLDIDKITTSLEWKPQTTFSKGLEEQYKWMKKIVRTESNAKE